MKAIFLEQDRGRRRETSCIILMLLACFLVKKAQAFITTVVNGRPEASGSRASCVHKTPLIHPTRARRISTIQLWGNDDSYDENADISGISISRRRKGGEEDSASSNEDTQEKQRAEIEKNYRQAEQVLKLSEAGATASQISAYSGIKLVKLEDRFTPEPKVTPSHMFIPRDEDGVMKNARFVYVDEYTCIGCTNCATCAPNTFFMEDDYGRARVFQQWVDGNQLIQTAIETCPVDCIHYVSYPELKRLEIEREGLTINYKARLVGSDGLLSGSDSTGLQDISGNRAYRCANCPTRGCFSCPVYGVGENPEYKRKKAEIEAKKTAKKALKQAKRRIEL